VGGDQRSIRILALNPFNKRPGDTGFPFNTMRRTFNGEPVSQARENGLHCLWDNRGFRLSYGIFLTPAYVEVDLLGFACAVVVAILQDYQATNSLPVHRMSHEWPSY